MASDTGASSDNIQMPGATIPVGLIPTFQGMLDWYRSQQSQSMRSPPRNGIPKNPLGYPRPPQRAILLQDLFAGGSALAAILTAAESPRTFIVIVVGINFVADSAFRLSGFVNSFGGSVNSGQPLFADNNETAPIPVNTTADEMRDIILASANPNIPFSRNDINVTVGNPLVHRDLVYTAESLLGQSGYPSENSPSVVTPDPDNPDDLPQSYTGIWIVEFRGYFDKPTLAVELESRTDNAGNDDAAYMRGQSSIVVRKMFDVDTGETEIVRDALDIGMPTPLKAGTKVVLMDFVDTGYNVIASGFREMDIDTEETQNVTDPPEDDA